MAILNAMLREASAQHWLYLLHGATDNHFLDNAFMYDADSFSIDED